MLNLDAWCGHIALESKQPAHREHPDPLKFYGRQKAWSRRYGARRGAKSWSPDRQRCSTTAHVRGTDHLGINWAFENAYIDCRLHIAAYPSYTRHASDRKITEPASGIYPWMPGMALVSVGIISFWDRHASRQQDTTSCHPQACVWGLMTFDLCLICHRLLKYKNIWVDVGVWIVTPIVFNGLNVIKAHVKTTARFSCSSSYVKCGCSIKIFSYFCSCTDM